jgi:hypothetical protein
MTSLYLVLLVISATFGAVHYSRWKIKSAALNWIFAALCCGSNGSLLLVLGMANRESREPPVFTSLFWFSASLEYVLALVSLVGSIWTLEVFARVLRKLTGRG